MIKRKLFYYLDIPEYFAYKSKFHKLFNLRFLLKILGSFEISLFHSYSTNYILAISQKIHAQISLARPATDLHTKNIQTLYIYLCTFEISSLSCPECKSWLSKFNSILSCISWLSKKIKEYDIRNKYM